MGMTVPHRPVLLAEALAALAPIEGAKVLDGTFGAGGYARAILAAGAARLIALDRDPTALAAAGEPAAGLTLVEASFDRLDEVAEDEKALPLDAVVLDIGVSSMQLDRAERGFSFAKDGPLDMRMGADGPSARDLVNRAPEASLADILHKYGEERAARRIARAIVAARAEGEIARTAELSTIVAGCLPRPRPGQPHPATRSFQALRIAVNDELGQLVRALAAAERALAPGGRLAVVTFHSLEDRIVKRFFQIGAGKGESVSRHAPERSLPDPAWARPAKPMEPAEAEIAANPRARSARLRAAMRTAAPPRAIAPARLGLPALPPVEELMGRRA